MKLSPQWIEKIYSGWLAKIIGIRLGAPVEGWTYEKIKETYGDTPGYLQDYKRFAADDDSNGPLFYLRALEDCKKSPEDMTPDDVAEALLNYAPFEHGFFWWGGYGYSTEHTAYLNLRNGIPAPQSGSIRQNGKMVAEQIGGQIFIDTWGLVAPGQPDLAAKLAEKAASVTHDGDGVHGGIFVAVCISYAFVERDIKKILEKGLSYIPVNCRYSQVVREVMAFYEEHPSNWELCYEYIYTHHGYDKYPGNCHIIPNIAVMVLALLYGKGDFSETLQICNRCGWDTDCNVGNIATIMGVRCGLEEIADSWRKPINDFLACSSVMGSLNIQDIPYGACYIAKLAWKIAGEELPEPWKTIIENRIHSAHFEFPGSTHAMEVRGEQGNTIDYELKNTDETACTGQRSLQVIIKDPKNENHICIYQRSYLRAEDFDDNRYSPAFSPVVYPGQQLHGSVLLPKGMQECKAVLYARNSRTGELYSGEMVSLGGGEWMHLEYQIPAMEGVLLDEVGYLLELPEGGAEKELPVYIDDFYADGQPEYSIEFSEEHTEKWTVMHWEVSQFTKLKGHFYLEDGLTHLSCADFGEAYTGRHDWEDYTADFTITPHTGNEHYAAVRVQGGVRAYFAGFSGDRLVIMKNTRQGLKMLAEVPFVWKLEETYTLQTAVKGNHIRVFCGDQNVETVDMEQPYLQGAIGLAVRTGSHMSCQRIRVNCL